MRIWISSRNIKVVGWLAISASAVTTIGIVWGLLNGSIPFNIGSFLNLLLTFVGINGGWLALKNDIVGKKLLLAFFLSQVALYQSQTFYFMLVTSISFYFRFGSSDGPMYGMNIYALVMSVLCLRILIEHNHLTRKGSGTPEAGAAS